MIDFGSLTPEEVARACEAAMRACDAGVAAIVATPADARTFDNTLVALEVGRRPRAAGRRPVRLHGLRRRR